MGSALSRVLDAAENASPVEAVEAVTRELGASLGATMVSFLIADLSGRALVRLSHGSQADEARGGHRSDGAGKRDSADSADSASVLPFDGGPVEQALRTQTVRVLTPGDDSRVEGGGTAGQWKVLAPVTERGEVIGLLEMFLPSAPGAEVVAEIARTAHLLGFVVIANRRHTDLFEWGQRSTPYTLPAEFNGGCCPRPSRVRRARSASRPGSSLLRTSAGTPSTTASVVMPCIFPSPTRWGTASRAH